MSTITERVKTFEDACEVLGINAAIPDFTAMLERYQKPLFAHYQLCVIAEALNEGWKPDWKNSYERKWNPVFDMDAGSSSSGRFSFNDSADRARVRLSALAFASELRNCQIMLRSNLNHFTGNTLY